MRRPGFSVDRIREVVNLSPHDFYFFGVAEAAGTSLTTEK